MADFSEILSSLPSVLDQLRYVLDLVTSACKSRAYLRTNAKGVAKSPVARSSRSCENTYHSSAFVVAINATVPGTGVIVIDVMNSEQITILYPILNH